MTDKKEMTAPYASVGADAGQPLMPNDDFDYNIVPHHVHKVNNLPVISMTELYDRVYLDKTPLIDGLLYPGTYLFVGAPKIGKSFLVSQIAYHISTGTPMWGYPVQQGRTLYLALEDNEERLQKRLFLMFGAEATDSLSFSVTANSIGKGLYEQLDAYISQYPDTKLIIIDTLQKVRESVGENYSYANDYQVISGLKRFADNTGICLLLVHHTRKQGADDCFDTISGTNGLIGAADGAFLLHKDKRTGNDAILEITGRDQQDQKLHLVRNPKTLLWELCEVECEIWKDPPDPLLEEIAQKITESNPVWQGTATALRDYLGVDIKPNSITQKLNVLANKLRNEYGIFYESTRNHDGRMVTLRLESREA